MTAELFSPPSRALSANADPYAGARWFFYQTGTLTLQTVYSDASLATPLPNPVVADSGGKFPTIYFDSSLIYRGICKDSTGAVTLHDIDPVNSGILSALASGDGSESVGFQQIGTGSQIISLASNEQAGPITPKQWGCVGDGTADDGTKFAALLSYASASGRTVELEKGKTYLLSTWFPLTTTGTLRIVGNGATVRGPVAATSFCLPTTDFEIESVQFDRWSTVFSRVTADTGSFNYVRVSNCRFINLTGISINLEKACTNYTIENNEWKTCSGGYALRIGDNLFSGQDTWSRGIIKNNRFLNLTGVGAASTAAMLIYGYSVLIDGNIIDGVLASSGEGWGIYVKTRYSIVTNNIIRNVNTTSGGEVVGINLKGAPRSLTSSPQGFSVVCSNNQIFNIGVMGVKGIGIRCQSDDLLVSSNILEDTGVRGIVSDDSNVYNDHLITGNKIRASSPTGFFALGIEGAGNRIHYTNNIVYNAIVGVQINPYVAAGLSEVLVSGNTLDSTVIGIQLAVPFNITGLKLHNNTILRASNAFLNNGGAGVMARLAIVDNDITGSATKFNGTVPPGTTIRNNASWLEGSVTYDPPSLVHGAGVTATVACSGASVGDIVRCSFGVDLQGILLNSWVSAPGTVSVRFQNESGGTVDLASSTLRVRTERTP